MLSRVMGSMVRVMAIGFDCRAIDSVTESQEKGLSPIAVWVSLSGFDEDTVALAQQHLNFARHRRLPLSLLVRPHIPSKPPTTDMASIG